MLLCAKQPQTQTPLILSSLLLALIRAVTVSYCPDAAHFLLCLGFFWVFVVFFFFRGSTNAFQVLGSIRFGLVLQIGFFTVYCLIIYKTCKGQLCTVNGLFQKTLPWLLCLPSAGMLDMSWRQELSPFLPWLRVHEPQYVFCRTLFMWLKDAWMLLSLSCGEVSFWWTERFEQLLLN